MGSEVKVTKGIFQKCIYTHYRWFCNFRGKFGEKSEVKVSPIHRDMAKNSRGVQGFRYRFRFISIVARSLKITENEIENLQRTAKSIKVKDNKQQDNTIQSYDRLQCSPVFWVVVWWPVVLTSSIQRTSTTEQQNNYHVQSIQKEDKKRKTKRTC